MLVASVAFILSLAYFEREGNIKAKNSIASYYDEKTDEYKEIELIKDGVKLKLLYFGCGANNCAGFQQGTNKIFYFPQTIGYSFLFDSTNVKNQAGGTPKNDVAS